MSRAFMIRGQHSGFHHWKVFPNPPTEEMMKEALAFEMEREGVLYKKDDAGKIVDVEKRECWVMVQTVELVDGKPDDDTDYVPVRLAGFVTDEDLETKLQLALNPETFQSKSAMPRIQMHGTATTEVITADDVGALEQLE